MHESRPDDPVHRERTGILARHPPFALTFAGFGRYPGVLYLDPHPHAPVKALTTDLTRRRPELVPYRGIFGPGLDPHLTIANHEGRRPRTRPTTHCSPASHHCCRCGARSTRCNSSPGTGNAGATGTSIASAKTVRVPARAAAPLPDW
ncbi:2'-5' RNA ligase family protein [Streptomyces sp. NPDC096046]|uniref:2'-5' RNA ligase family protein n=1 Tax=Streptomyces sp. NPDC096046 TaxID=3155542 RepID=UPI0033255606